MLVIAVLILVVLVWVGTAKLAFKLERSATVSVGGGFLCAVAALAFISYLFVPGGDKPETVVMQPVEVTHATRAGSQVMTDADLHRAESILAFKLAGIAFGGLIVVLLVFGEPLRLVFLSGPVLAIGLGMTVLQTFLGLQHYAKGNNWSHQSIEYLSWGYVGFILFLACWWATWAKLQEGR